MLAVLSNINIDPIKVFFKGEKIYLSPYNKIKEEFLNPNSFINSNKGIKKILIFLDYSELLVGSHLNKNDLDLIQQDFELVINLVENYSNNNKDNLIIINNQLIDNNTLAPYIKNSIIDFYNLEKNMNDKLYKVLKNYNNIYLLDWIKLIRKFGIEKLFNRKYWYIGRMKLSTLAYELIYKEINNILDSINGKYKKVCIIDLDNTIWGGILGDDGIEGIILSEEGVGKSYRDFQKCIRSLTSLGVLLAVVSKNNIDVVKECFNRHPMMELKIEDFIALKVNWKNKVENIKEIAKELNLGLDSFLFIDDDKFERNFVKEYLPQVEVPDFPTDPYALTDWFYKIIIPEYFKKSVITEEDLSKNKQYKANIERNKLEKEIKDYNTYLKELDINLKIYLNDPNQIIRIAQLTQKTNQFNLTNKRYTELDIRKMMSDSNIYIYTLEYSDKYGKEGIVGVVIINKQIDCKKYIIDNYLLSCRVFGRYIEYNFLKIILIDLNNKSDYIEEIVASYIPTEKNTIVKEYYTNCGFTKTEEGLFYGKIKYVINFLKENYIDIQGEIK